MADRHGPEGGETSERVARIRRVLWGVLLLNLTVALVKLVWGRLSGSVAMQADGFHSLFDGTSNVIGLLGMRLAGRPADRDHPYGHGKYETYASLGIGVMLAFAAYNVGGNAVAKLMAGAEPAQVTVTSFAVMVGTLIVNLVITTYERRVGKRIGSDILLADSAHTASDVWVSMGVIAGLVAVRLGYPVVDPLVALLVAGVIAWTAFGIFKQATATLSDTVRIPPAEVCAVARSVPGVLGCHHVRTRGTEAETYVDLHVQVDPQMSVSAAHAISVQVERRICDSFTSAVDVVVHIEPLDAYQQSKTAEEIDAGLA